MLHFNNSTNSIHNPGRSNFLFLPILLLLIIGCKKEQITPSGKQTTEIRHPGAFKMISTNSAVNIHITHGDNHSVIIKGSDNLIKHFNTTVANGELKLAYQNGNITSNDVEVWLTMPALESIVTSGSGNVEIQGIFSDQHSLTTRVGGSGNIIVEGLMRTNFLKSYVSGSGTTDLSSIWANIAEFELPGSGSVKINVSEELKANMTGSGDIYFSGNPTITSDIKGTGKLIKINTPND